MKVVAITNYVLKTLFLFAQFELKKMFLPILLVITHSFSVYASDVLVTPRNVNVKSFSRYSGKKIDSYTNNGITISTSLKSSYCTGEVATIVCEASGNFDTNNIFTAELSNANGNFSNPTIIGSVNSAYTGSNTITIAVPLKIPAGNGYRIRIKASSPATVSPDNGTDIQITTLTIPNIPSTTQNICLGQTAVLSGSCTQGSIKWYDAEIDGNEISSTSLSPTITTEYFAACKDVVCSSMRVKHTVNVSNLSSIFVPASFSSCLNSNVELTVITDDENLQYNWTGPNGFTATSQAPTIDNLTPAKEGIYTVNITNISNCSATATTNVSIGTSLQSLNVIGNVSACYNGTISLTAYASVTSGMTYSWTGSNSFTATGQSMTRAASTTDAGGNIVKNDGLYTVEAYNPTTGCSGITYVYISVGNKPTVPALPPTGSTCEGATYVLDWAIGGANFRTYSWTGPDNFTSTSTALCNNNFTCLNATANVPNFSSAKVGVYTINANFIDDINNSCVISASTNVTLKPKPDITVSSNSPICFGETLNLSTTFTDATSGISTYAWVGPNGFTSNLRNPSINNTTTAADGIYNLTAIGLNGCTATASTNVQIIQSSPPVVSSVANVVLGNSITLTASGCSGTLNWFKASDNEVVAMPVSPTTATQYYAKCNISGCISDKSGNVTVTILPPVAISQKTGDWEDRTTWNINRVPLGIDSVIILANHVVTIQNVATAKWLSYANFGSLRFASVNSKLNILGNPITIPPIIVSSPSPIISGISNTLSTTADGTITWYKNGVNTGNTGNSYTITNPMEGDIWTAIRTVDGIASKVSNAITVLQIPSAPSISSSPSPMMTGISTTLSTTATGNITWFKNGENTGITGSSHVVSNPTSGDVWTAKQTVNSLTSDVSNSITVYSVPPAPTISSIPSPMIAGTSTTLSTTATGNITWFKNGTNTGITGSSHVVSNPTAGDVWTAKQTVNSLTSDVSNSITVQSATPSGGVVITEPNKPPYYFSDGHPPSHYDNKNNLPAIFINQPRYDPVNDMVWLQNDKIKIGINLKRGGQLAWASLVNATTNLVYNGYDGGFQVTLDAYQKKDGYSQQGEVAGSGNPGNMPTSYNVTHGGDYLNHAASLIDYHQVPNGYYVKLRPIHYPMNAKHSETYIEATYTIIGRSVKIDYRYTSFRTDGQWSGAGFDGAGAPACFIVSTLNKYKTYTGNSPWTFAPVNGNVLPIINNGQNPAGVQATEYWGMVYSDQHPESGIGVYNATDSVNSTFFTFKQWHVYAGNPPGTEFENGFTFFQPFISFNNIEGNRGNYVKDITAYLIIGSEFDIRSEVYKISGHQSNIPRF
jgi:hypothetical protein